MANHNIPNRPAGTDPRSIADILGNFDYITDITEGLAAGNGFDSKAIDTPSIADGAIEATQLATDAVETAKIKDSAVTVAKLAAGVIQAGRVAATGQLTVGDNYSDIPGASVPITVARASLLIVIMTFDFYHSNGTAFFGALNLGGSVQVPVAHCTHANGANNERRCLTQTVVASIGAGTVTAKLQAKKNGSTAVVGQFDTANTGFTYIVVPG